MDSLYIVMPAYNEAENIENTIKAWYPIVEIYNGDKKSRLVIVNDGSKDETLKKGRELMKSYPLLEVLDKPNSGHGPTVIYAYDYAIKNKADYIFQTDSDGQTNPDEFHNFFSNRENFAAQFGNRTVRGDGKDRAFVEKVVCLLCRIIFGVKVPDANAPFRLYKREYLEKYLKKLPKDFNLPNIMMSVYFVHYKEKVDFKEISFKPRTAGTNSINFKKIIKIGIKAVKDFYKLRKEL